MHIPILGHENTVAASERPLHWLRLYDWPLAHYNNLCTWYALYTLYHSHYSGSQIFSEVKKA